MICGDGGEEVMGWRVPAPPLFFLITDSLLLGPPIESALIRRSVDLPVPVLVDQEVNAFGISTPAGSRGCLTLRMSCFLLLGPCKGRIL